MHGSRMLCQRRSKFETVFFLVLIDEIREDQNTTKKQAVIDLLTKRYLNGLRANNGPTLYASLVAM